MTMFRVALATADFSYCLIPRTSFVEVGGKVVPCIPRIVLPVPPTLSWSLTCMDLRLPRSSDRKSSQANPVVAYTPCRSVLAGMPKFVPYVEAYLNISLTQTVSTVWTSRIHDISVRLLEIRVHRVRL